MLNRLFLCLFALCISSAFSQESYKVIKVQGSIILDKSQAELMRGTTFAEDDELTFKSTGARAAVINPQQGRFILKSDNSDAVYAKAYLTPAMSNISSRSGAILTINDLKMHFEGNYAIIDKAEIKVSSQNFPMNEKAFFYIQYIYKGEKINKQLEAKGDLMIIEKNELFKIDGKPISADGISQMTLFYYKKETESKSTKINTFNLTFINKKELKEEIKLLLSELKGKKKQEKIDEIIGYIFDMYGKADKKAIEEWANSNFSL